MLGASYIHSSPANLQDLLDVHQLTADGCIRDLPLWSEPLCQVPQRGLDLTVPGSDSLNELLHAMQ